MPTVALLLPLLIACPKPEPPAALVYSLNDLTPRVASRLSGRLVPVRLTVRPGPPELADDGRIVHDLGPAFGSERSAWLFAEMKPVTAVGHDSHVPHGSCQVFRPFAFL